ncbi:glutamate--cysteine ligase catalytic subunit [Nematocida major]|uniref:glutamate--cysteine ligase catalytic subunit n=1 Tax=Nematocida major TaxID=1912982 RepID=UPI002008E8FB|nr:glutamate--cysteine ligase catalytic subunit [Nematocida major]KAH9385367.1 glutamate--cysteine ligase catalytic subunit [Nematocida major]
MGLLKESKILTWEETQRHSPEMKRRGIEHFIKVYHNKVAPKIKEFLWGEELEQHIIAKVNKNWILLLGADEILRDTFPENSLLHPEYAGYMLESTPAGPYAPGFHVLARLEENLEARRKSLMRSLHEKFGPDVSLLFLPAFPLLGTPWAFGTSSLAPEEWLTRWESAGNFSEIPSPSNKSPKTPLEKALEKAKSPTFKITNSLHFPDFAITQHKRFFGFSQNIPKRKGVSLHHEIPVMGSEKGNPQSPAVIDSMGQGMGCACLQITMQCESVHEARTLYDNIAAICPLLLFMTAATPYADGKLLKTSTRWEIVGASVDCRQPQETHIRKSRYSSVDIYTSILSKDLDIAYNDINPPLEICTFNRLIEAGVDFPMARHISSLYIRDPVLCYSDASPEDDFENIQSSNWRSMRLKPPKAAAPESANSGWLVETRPMEIQPTSFENAAYSVFVVVFSRMILSLNINVLIPISKVDENFEAANNPKNPEDPVQSEREQVFWYRANIFSQDLPVLKQGTVQEIFLGAGEYVGIFGALEIYLKEYAEADTDCIMPYLEFLRERVSGKKCSVSAFIRRFVCAHKAYSGDAKITPEISNDLTELIVGITQRNSTEYLVVE